MESNNILKLENIEKYFKDHKGNFFKALKGINITLEQGECIGIVGESGCGKSTLAKIISHLLKTSEGNIFFKDKDITNLKGKTLKEYYKHVQMIFQNPLETFSPRMKIGTYLMEPFINFKLMDKKMAYEYVQNLLHRVGLDTEFMMKYPNQLSGGQLQRVVIARAIGMKPDVIICDECTSALDVSIQKQIVNLLVDLKDKTNFSSVFITHDLALAENMCDKIYVMYLGEIVEVIKSKNLLRDAKHPYTKMLLQSVFSTKNFDKKFKSTPLNNIKTPVGCSFAPYCENRFEKCFEQKSYLKALSQFSSVACHLYKEEL